MRLPRLTKPGTTAFYSICAKVVDGLFKFDAKFKEEIILLLYDVADFCGIAIIDCAVMTNHLHIEAMVLPKATFVPDDEVLRRVGVLYGEKKGQELRQAVDTLREAGDEETVLQLLAPYRNRMNDLSQFMKTFMQRITMKYNGIHGRAGTLWQGRFHSTLAERADDLVLLRLIAAYLDLNALRAGMVDDPSLYPWCGYGRACIKGRLGERAREGLARLYPGDPVWLFMKKHRQLLLARFAKKGMNRKKEAMPFSLDLSMRQATMTCPRVIGRRAFVLQVLDKLPKRAVRELGGDFIAVGGERKHHA